ncbi:unnamed protein product [Closterium sp. Yama58-4]|nr:unnamed protein product [Closterium sp. Yama58-4]
MDVWGPARVTGQGCERYFLLVVDDYSRYTTVFPLHSKGEVPAVLIPWIRAVRLQLRERFQTEVVSSPPTSYSQDFCRGEGIIQSFTLLASPQQNGIAERRIGLVMDVARTSMIHAAAPHFLWPFAVRYAAHQLNLWPYVSLSETSHTLLWTGEVGDASVFRVWGSRAFVRDTSADKLSSRTIPCVFLGFPPDAPGWQFYHPTSRRVLPRLTRRFTSTVSSPIALPLSPLRRSSSLQPVEVTGDSGAAGSGLARGATSGGAEPGGAELERAEPGGGTPERAEPGGAEPRGAEPGGAAPKRTELRGAERGGADSGGAEPGGATFAGGLPRASPQRSPQRETLSPQQLREWRARRTRLRSRTSVGYAGAGGAGAGGARAGGAGTGGAGAGGSDTGGAGAGGTDAGAIGAGGAGTGGAGAGGTVQQREPLLPQQRVSGLPGAPAFGVALLEALELEVLKLKVLTLEALELEALELEVLELEALELEALALEALELEVLTLEVLELEAPELEVLALEALELELLELKALELSVLVLEALELEALPFEVLGLVTLELEALELELLVLATMALEALVPRALYNSARFSYPHRSCPTYRLKRREPASRPASPVRAVRTARRVPRPRPPPVPGTHTMALRPSSAPQRVPLPSPPASSLPELPDPESDAVRAASPTVTRLLATVVTDPSFESAAASALVAELVDFAAVCHLDYAARLVADSEFVCPPSVGGECALSTDVFEDRQEDFESLAAAVPHLVAWLLAPEGDPDALDIPTPRSYTEAILGPYSSQWQTAMDTEMASWKSTGTYVDEVPPPGANIVDDMWIFKGVDFFLTSSPTPKMTTLRVLLHVAAQRDYELHSLDFSTAFLQGSLHEEIWLRRPPGFTGSFPPGTQWSLRRPVYGLRQVPREWHDTLRMTLAALGFAPSTADPSLFLRTDTSLPPFYILVYVDDLVFATADTEALALVKSELQKRHTCTDLGELRSYLGLQITRDRARRTITLTQSHMVQQVLQRFGFQFSSPQSTPLSTSHSLSAPPSDESVEPSGPYPELVGCLMYLMTCTRPDLAYPLSILARYVAPGRHRREHWEAAKRVLRYLCSTSGMGLVLGGRGPVVLTGHSDAS